MPNLPFDTLATATSRQEVQSYSGSEADTEIPPRSLAAGMPAKVIRALSQAEIAWKVDGTRTCQDLARRNLATMTESDPLSQIEPDRKHIHMPEVMALMELKKR